MTLALVAAHRHGRSREDKVVSELSSLVGRVVSYCCSRNPLRNYATDGRHVDDEAFDDSSQHDSGTRDG